MEIEGSDSEKNKGEKNRYSPIIHLNDYERKLLLQCAGKFQLNKYFESLDTIKIEMHEKFIQMSKLFKDFGYARSANTLGHQYLPLKRQAMERMSLFYVKRRGVKPRKVDYIFAYLFPKYFEGLGLDMNELMADV
uniref:Uncharacterized protein LOC114337371 n=1 Tax=Diabrotica virgifera virgifera TaxID=50390 RepID=A0A6P7G3N3_DIAVI